MANKPSFLKKFRRKDLQNSGLFWFLLVALYLVVGALIFGEIEKVENQTATSSNQQVLPTEIKIDKLFAENMTKKYENVTLGEFTSLFRDIEKYIYKEKEQQNTNKQEVVESKPFYQWFYFCFITLTTIGYGDITVATNGGKVFLIFYALGGIPIMLALLGIVGNKLASIQSIFFSFCIRKKLIHSRFERVFLTMSSALMFIIYILCGSAITTHEEKWDFLTSLYFWFVTFSTIGYGDYTPHGKSAKVGKIFGWIFYRIIGLALVATVINAIFARMTKNSNSESDDGTNHENSNALEGNIKETNEI